MPYTYAFGGLNTVLYEPISYSSLSHAGWVSFVIKRFVYVYQGAQYNIGKDAWVGGELVAVVNFQKVLSRVYKDGDLIRSSDLPLIERYIRLYWIKPCKN